MTQRDYVLTDAAEADMREIIRYTRKQWGDAQVHRYISNLEQGIARLANRQGVFREMDSLWPGLCMAQCEQHYIFCLARKHAPALVVAILHERMDLMVRLNARLGV